MIKVFLVDDHHLILEAIKAVLEVEPKIAIVGTAQDGKSAIAQVVKLKPDFVLLDLEMPKVDGITATRYITQYLPDTKVIILTSHKEKVYVTKALRAGASGYIVKDSLVQDLKRAIYSLSRGYCYIETKLLNPAVNQIQASNITRRKTKYLKKYRKHIYSPSITGSPNRPKLVKTTAVEAALTNSGKAINKALAPIFNLATADRHQQPEWSAIAAHRAKQKRKYYQKLAKRILLVSLVILSLILSVIMF